MKRLVLVIVLLVAIPAMLVSVGCGNESKSESASVEDSINGFVTAYNAGDFDKCTDYLVGITDANKDTIAQQLEAAKALIQSIEVNKIDDINVDGSTATAKVTVAAMGQTQTNVINLTKVDGKWKFAGGDFIPQTGG